MKVPRGSGVTKMLVQLPVQRARAPARSTQGSSAAVLLQSTVRTAERGAGHEGRA
ncbi:MAG TPA: hypothetical protein PKW35_14250 [Nannocystaceae bacterium]|nr:hypothetical protein [Nannocystaceae bacterium]